jgi:hypothetical protein
MNKVYDEKYFEILDNKVKDHYVKLYNEGLEILEPHLLHISKSASHWSLKYGTMTLRQYTPFLIHEGELNTNLIYDVNLLRKYFDAIKFAEKAPWIKEYK